MDQLNNKTHENWFSMNITEFVHLHVYKSSLNIVHLIYTPFYVHKHVYHTYQSIHTFRLLFFIHVHVNIQTIYTASIIMYVRHTCIHITSVCHMHTHHVCTSHIHTHHVCLSHIHTYHVQHCILWFHIHQIHTM